MARPGGPLVAARGIMFDRVAVNRLPVKTVEFLLSDFVDIAKL